MAKVDIKYNCGCGFLTHDLAAATAHCDTMFHDMSINGIIHSTTRTSAHQATPKNYRPTTVDKHGDKLYGRSSEVKVIEPTVEIKQQEIHKDFNLLKAKLALMAALDVIFFAMYISL